MKESVFAMTVLGLTQTAIEKICVLGYDEAKADAERIRAVIDDMTSFWDYGYDLLKGFDSEVEAAKGTDKE